MCEKILSHANTQSITLVIIPVSQRVCSPPPALGGTMPRLMPQNSPQSNLDPLRLRIDQLDQDIIKLLNERAKVVVEIGKVKQHDNSPIYAPDREQQVLAQVRKYNQGPLPDTCLEAIWRELMSGSFALERALKIGYLGPPGSFSHLAARLKFGVSVEYAHLDDIGSVFDQTARGHIDLGLVPIENSAMGGIGETLDCFLQSPARVFAEVLIHVHHNVLAQCPLDQIKRVYSRPEVFSQCRQWVNQNLSHTQRVAVESSSKAAQIAADEPNAAAIGSTLAAELYKLQIQAQNIEDNPTNVTRFFVISNQQPGPSKDDKTAVMFTTAHQPGALANVLDTFRDHNLNLTHIDKRPSQRVNWEYYFFVDFAGHESDPKVAAALEAVRARCQQLTVLGSFPRAQEVLS